jgi:hypothetical protein
MVTVTDQLENIGLCALAIVRHRQIIRRRDRALPHKSNTGRDSAFFTE